MWKMEEINSTHAYCPLSHNSSQLPINNYCCQWRIESFTGTLTVYSGLAPMQWRCFKPRHSSGTTLSLCQLHTETCRAIVSNTYYLIGGNILGAASRQAYCTSICIAPPKLFSLSPLSSEELCSTSIKHIGSLHISRHLVRWTQWHGAAHSHMYGFIIYYCSCCAHLCTSS